jgi:hypothetical protein
MQQWKQILLQMQQPENYTCSDSVFQIPVHTAPKVVTIIKTNRPHDAVNLFQDALLYSPQPDSPEKPGLFSRLASVFKSKASQERQRLLDDPQSTQSEDTSRSWDIEASEQKSDLEA